MRPDAFDPAAFLRDTWQKQPLLIRNPWAAWANPLDPDELAGLACQDGVQSRLVTREGAGWTVEHGPLPEERFAQLPASQWTLLVQAVDHFVPEVAALIDPFRFIPNWRIDDVMVSYATDQGGVGPHFDQYDVFLIQGLGTRRWQVGAPCDESARLLPHDDLRLLADFEPVAEWVLEPGDILYVPPRVPHEGIALGDDCMTYSVGFRAPSRRELIGAWCDDMLAGMDSDDRYADPDLAPQGNPGEISADAIARLHALVTERMLDRASFAQWFGAYTSTPKYPDEDCAPDEPIGTAAVRAAIAEGRVVMRNPASRFTFITAGPEALTLFVDGEDFACTGPSTSFAEALCARDNFAIDPALGGSDSALELIAALHDQGSIAFED